MSEEKTPKKEAALTDAALKKMPFVEKRDRLNAVRNSLNALREEEIPDIDAVRRYCEQAFRITSSMQEDIKKIENLTT